MAVSFLAAGTPSATLFSAADGASAAASGNLTSVPLPAGIADDDILVLVIHGRDNVAVTINQGYTIKVEGNGGANDRLTVAWKRVSGAQTAPTITHTAGGSIVACIYAFRGCVASGDPWEAAQGAVESESAATPFTNSGVTAVTAGSMAFLAFGSSDDNSWTYNAGFATNVHFLRNQAGSDDSVGIAYGNMGAGVATGNLVVNQSALGADTGVTWSGVLQPAAAYSGIGLIRQFDSNAVTGAATTRVLNVPVEAGVLLVLGVGWENGVTASVADADGNTWNAALAMVDDGSNRGRVWTCVPATTRSSLAITITFSGGSNFNEYILHALYGADTSSPVDKTQSSSGSSNAPSTGTAATTTVADEYLFAFLRAFASVDYSAWTNSFTEVHDGGNIGVATRTVSSTGTYSTAATIASNAWIGIIVTIKKASTSQPIAGTSVQDEPTGGAAALTTQTAIVGQANQVPPTAGAAALTTQTAVVGTSVQDAPAGGAADLATQTAIAGGSNQDAPTGGAATVTPGAVDVAGTSVQDAPAGGAAALTTETGIAGAANQTAPAGGAAALTTQTDAVGGSNQDAPTGGQGALTSTIDVAGGSVPATPTAGAATVAHVSAAQAVVGTSVSASPAAGAAALEQTVTLTPEQLEGLRHVRSGRNALRPSRVNHRLPVRFARRPRRR